MSRRLLRPPRRAARSAVLLVLAAAGCAGGADDPLSPRGLAGRYVLATIDGRPLPTEEPGSGLVVSDELALDADGTFTETLLYRPSPLQSSTLTDMSTGRWAVSGTTVRLTFASNGAVLSAAASGGNTLTLLVGNGPYVYRK